MLWVSERIPKCFAKSNIHSPPAPVAISALSGMGYGLSPSGGSSVVFDVARLTTEALMEYSTATTAEKGVSARRQLRSYSYPSP